MDTATLRPRYIMGLHTSSAVSIYQTSRALAARFSVFRFFHLPHYFRRSSAVSGRAIAFMSKLVISRRTKIDARAFQRCARRAGRRHYFSHPRTVDAAHQQRYRETAFAPFRFPAKGLKYMPQSPSLVYQQASPAARRRFTDAEIISPATPRQIFGRREFRSCRVDRSKMLQPSSLPKEYQLFLDALTARFLLFFTLNRRRRQARSPHGRASMKRGLLIY